jgi:hypothetical protein
MTKRRIIGLALTGLGLLLAGCGVASQEAASIPETITDQEIIQSVAESVSEPGPAASPTQPVATAPSAVELPTREPEDIAKVGPSDAAVAVENLILPKPDNQLAEGEYRWSQLLGRDSIPPVYDPQFAPAAEAPYNDDELVIGVEINGEAKAYAIGPLNSREMVNDTVGGIPILVTW